MRAFFFGLALLSACSSAPTTAPVFRTESSLQARFTYKCGSGVLPVQFECDFDGTGSRGAVVQYLWTFPQQDPILESTGQISYVFPSAGRYYVVLSVTDGAEWISTVKQINVR